MDHTRRITVRLTGLRLSFRSALAGGKPVESSTLPLLIRGRFL